MADLFLSRSVLWVKLQRKYPLLMVSTMEIEIPTNKATGLKWYLSSSMRMKIADDVGSYICKKIEEAGAAPSEIEVSLILSIINSSLMDTKTIEPFEWR